MTDEELQAAIRKRDAQREARDVKKAARLGTLAAQMDKANFRYYVSTATTADLTKKRARHYVLRRR